MTQVHKIYQYEDVSTQSNEQNQFEEVERIVDDIVKQGIPKNLSFSEFVVFVSNNYNINVKEAKTCIKLALSELGENCQIDKEENQDELYAQSGYYYPNGYNTTSTNSKNDGMDSLSCLGSYNKLMFLR